MMRTRLFQILFLTAAFLLAGFASDAAKHIAYAQMGVDGCLAATGGPCVTDVNGSCAAVGLTGTWPFCVSSDTCASAPTTDGCTCTVSNGCSTGTGIYINGSCSLDPSLLPACPVCTATTCFSSANECGQTSQGTAQSCTDGTTSACSATTPPPAVDQCPNDAGIQCSSTQCSTPPPPPPSCVANQGSACTSSPNSCGATNGTIACDGSCTPPAPTCALPSPTVSISASPNPIPVGSTLSTLTWSSANTSICTGTNFRTNGQTNNATGVSVPVGTYTINCTGTNGTQVSRTVQVTADTGTPGGTTPPPSGGTCTDTGTPTLTASPNLVQTNTSTSVTFTFSVPSTSGSCTLSGPGITTQTISSTASCTLSSSTYTASVTAAGQSIYTLSCPGGRTAKAIVNVTPNFKEF